MKKTEKPKKLSQRLKFPKVNLNFQDLTLQIAIIILFLPIIVCFWIAIPNISIDYDDRVYSVNNILQDIDFDGQRLGFLESYNVQNGLQVKYSIPKPESIQSDEEFNSQVEASIDKFIKRANSVGLKDSQLFIQHNVETSEKNLILKLAGTRENLGFNIPNYLRMNGEVDLWVDDPNYKPPEGDSEASAFLNPTEGKVEVGINEDDISSVEVINDAKTSGWGLKLTFNPEVFEKLSTASSNVGTGVQPYGFLLTVDGQAVAFQSYPYGADANQLALYFTSNGQDLYGMRTIASIINFKKYDATVSVVSNNNIINTPLAIEMSLFKLSLFVGFVITLGVFLRYAKTQLITVIFMVSNLTLAISAFKLTQQYLTIELILGTISGLLLISFFQLIKFRNIDSTDNLNLIQNELSKFRTFFGKILIVPFIILLIISTSFSPQSIKDFVLAIAVMWSVAVILELTTFRLFSYQLFIHPKLNAKK